MAIKRIALGYHPALLDAAANYLTQEVSDSGIADFSGVLVLTTTDEAARRFRAAVAYRFVGRGVVGLELGLFASLLKSNSPVASKVQTLKAWSDVLSDIPESEVATLLPDLARHRHDRHWRIGTAEMLQECRVALAAEGRSLEEVYSELDLLCKKCDEQVAFCRFGEFYRLEKCYLNQLEGTNDPVSLTLNAIRTPPERPEIKKIVLLGAPDPMPAALMALERYHERGIDIDVLIGANESELDDFDIWGRPRAEVLVNREIKLDLSKQVRCIAGPFEQAQKISARLQEDDYAPFAIGVLDGEIAAALEARLRIEKSAYQCRTPRAEKLHTTSTGLLFVSLLKLRGREISFDLVSELLRSSRVFFALDSGAEMAKTIIQLDKLQNSHLPATLGEAIAFFGSKIPALSALEAWHQRVRNSANPLHECYGIFQQIETLSPPDESNLSQTELELEALKQVILEVLDAVDDSDEALELTALMIAGAQIDRAPTPAAVAIDLAGFLELPFFTEKNLLITGFNEESFNYRRMSDAFLPEQARIKLKMRTSLDQYAADVWRFDYLTRFTQAAGGGVQIMYGRCGADGKDLTPARLLMQCSQEELPIRVEKLFGSALEEPIAGPCLDTEVTLCLPESVELPRRFSVTSFKKYLDSPFLFYCDRVLKSEYVDDRKIELDPLQYGTLLHRVLERFGRFYSGGDAPGEIEEFVFKNFRAILKEDFNISNNGILQIQTELMESALGVFAHEQSKQQQDGWKIAEIETAVEVGFDELFYGHPGEDGDWRKGIRIIGKLDRIDVNCITGQVRVLDYKTSSQAYSPLAASTKKKSQKTQDQECFLTPEGRRWTDLQLPLYVWFIKRHLSKVKPPEGLPIECGYFNLPMEKDKAGVELFDKLDEALLASALTCADQVLENVYVKKNFWPMTRSLKESDSLFELLGAAPARLFGDLVVPVQDREARDE